VTNSPLSLFDSSRLLVEGSQWMDLAIHFLPRYTPCNRHCSEADTELQVKNYSHSCHKSFATSDSAEAFLQAGREINYRIYSINTEATAYQGNNGTHDDELAARLDKVTLHTLETIIVGQST